ncbi:MAG: PIN domain-containing protein [Trueperaceae bacterium]
MASTTAFLDASVLYPAPLRDLLMHIALTDLYRARWSSDVHREWIEALLRKDPTRVRAKLERTRDLMNTATRDALVSGYEGLISAIELPDSDDRHVLAAAVVGRCDVIVTRNLRHFPPSALAPYGIEALDPDRFLHAHLTLAPGLFCVAVAALRGALRQPPVTVSEYLETLEAQGLVATATELARYPGAI